MVIIRQTLLPIALAFGIGCSNPVAMPLQRPEETPIISPVRSIDAIAFEAPHIMGQETCITVQENSSLLPYVQMLQNNDDLASAIGLCDLPGPIQDAMWQKLLQAEETGASPTVSFEQPYNGNKTGGSIAYDENEVFEIVGARLAHALWIDHHRLVPWRLSEYNRGELTTLLSPTETFLVWDPDHHSYRDAVIVDHDPAIAYRLAIEALGGRGVDQESAVIALVDSVRRFRHGIAGRDEFFIRTLEEKHDERVSIYGCMSKVNYLVALARALNIPARPLQGYYDAGNHTSAVFESIGYVLAHGDDVYAALLRNTPSEELLDDLLLWQENILIHPPGDERVRNLTRQHNYENAMRFPSLYLAMRYCEQGRPYLEETFAEFADPEQIDELGGRLDMMTDNCSHYAPWDP